MGLGMVIERINRNLAPSKGQGRLHALFTSPEPRYWWALIIFSMSERSDVSSIKSGISRPSARPRVAINASVTTGTGVASEMCRREIDFFRQRVTAHAPEERLAPSIRNDHRYLRPPVCTSRQASPEGAQKAPRKERARLAGFSARCGTAHLAAGKRVPRSVRQVPACVKLRVQMVDRHDDRARPATELPRRSWTHPTGL